jgi:lambda family phage portal protein
MVKERFQLWAQNPTECDITRKRNFYQGQALAYRTVCSRGDCFVLLPKKKHPGGAWAAKFQLIEGDRCINPQGQQDTETLSQGVTVDAVGGVLRYHFAKKHPAGWLALKPEDIIPVDAWDADGRRQVLHLFHENRLDLRRGYPLLAPVIAPLKQMSRLSESELAASVVSSFFAVVIKKTGSGPSPFGGTVTKDSNGKGFVNLGPAIVAELGQGEEIQNVNPTRPNGAFDPFWASLMGQIAMRIQVPPEVLLKKFESSYTAARGALLQFWKFVTTERENLLAPNFCQPLYEMWLTEEVSAGRIVATGFFRDPILRAALCSAKWIGDNPPILDPLKEVLAAQEQLDYCLTTHAEQTARLNGGDFESNLPRLIRENRLKVEGGITPDPKTPVVPKNTDPGTPPTLPDGTKNDENARRAALLRVAEDTHEDVVALRRDLALISNRPVHVEVQASAPAPAPVIHVAAPAITMPPVTVNVTAPKAGTKTVQLDRDPEGRLTGAHVEEES